MTNNPDDKPKQLSQQDMDRLKEQGAVLISVDDIFSERNALHKNPITAELVEKWHSRGGFFDPKDTRDSIETETLMKLLAEAKKGNFTFWTRDGFEPDVPPEPYHHGLSLCINCGWVYWSSFDDDAFDHQKDTLHGQVCLPCLLTLREK